MNAATSARTQALIANKADMTHLRVVKPEQHNNWAKEHDMYRCRLSPVARSVRRVATCVGSKINAPTNSIHRSYFVSAKTGDNVHSTFFRIAADLAGVVRARSTGLPSVRRSPLTSPAPLVCGPPGTREDRSRGVGEARDRGDR